MRTSTILVICTLLLLFITSASVSGTIEKPCSFSAQFRLYSQQLFVSVQPSLYNYYSNMTHEVFSDNDYAKFVTPQAVQPIAQSILGTTYYSSFRDEQFANAVLAIVHQIPYKITGAKYPVETLIDNYGDCGAVSLLAASIMKAGGLDVVLIKYTGIDPGHMNVGVHLPHPPMYHSLLIGRSSFEYNNKTYWTAEATPQGDWKVGDQSYELSNAKLIIIPLDTIEESPPGHVSSSLVIPLPSSSITTDLSPQLLPNKDNNRSLVISGSIHPTSSQSSVTIYINKNGSCTNYFKTATDNFGRYTLTWNFTSDGTYYVTTNWSGNETIAGADGETLVVFVGPEALTQFQTDTYNYIVGRAIGNSAVRPFIGVNDFLSIQLGTNISVSYSFVVLPAGHSASQIETQNITVPASERIIKIRNKPTQIIQVPSRTIIVPVNIPRGLEPLTLPDDFNQTINSKFSFIFQSNQDNNSSLQVKGLDDYEVSNIKQDNESNTAFLNATEGIEESTWYKVTSTISEAGISTNLQKEDGTAIESMSVLCNSESSAQLVLLIANNEGRAVALKELNVQAVNDTSQSPTNFKQTPGGIDLVLPYVTVIVILAVTFAAAAVYVKKNKKNCLPNRTKQLI
jgi:hypothetical protein